jgi:hypothetical protein
VGRSSAPRREYPIATLAQLRAGLKTRLETIASLQGVYAEAPAQVSTPGAVVRYASPAITYATTLGGGSHDYSFSILLLVSTAQGSPAQSVLDPYLDTSGADSVYAAVDADPDLGLSGVTAMVTSVANAGPVTWAGAEYLGAEFLVTVLA